MTTKTDALTLELHFDSDWHVGDGVGQHGLADRIVRRHAEDRLPFVPAKTVTGIWRDACERVAQGLDNDEPGHWVAWVEALFGDEPALRDQHDVKPRPALLSVRPARLPDGLRMILKASRQLRDAMTLIKPGVKIDPHTGQALTDHLRFEELVRTGACLESRVDLDLADSSLREAALALLWAGAKTVERLGGKRRRGAGRCHWAFDAITSERALELLEADAPKPPPPESDTPTRSFGPVGVGAAPASTSTWFRVPLVLMARTPLVIPRAVIGNVVESHDHVPGTHLLGPVSKRLGMLGVDLFPWVAAGALRVCHAYPEVESPEPVRGRPVPMVIAAHKEDGGLEEAGGKARNRLLEAVNDDDGPQWRPYRSGYVGPFPDQWLPAFDRPSPMLTTHATIEGESQRPTESVGGAYSYQAISPGSTLHSEVWVAAELAERLAEHQADWWQVLSGEARLGRARKDDYGLVELVPCEPERRKPIGTDDIDQLVVWLLSDLLSRDDLLQPATTLDSLQAELELALPDGTRLASADPGRERLSHLLRTRRTDGWHQGWGLPRPSYIGLAAGSCAVFDVAAGHLTEADVQALVHRGLGERRAEGFGEISVNDPLLRATLAGKQTHPSSERARKPSTSRPTRSRPASSETPEPRGSAADYLAHLRRVALRARLQQSARIHAADRQFRIEVLGWKGRRPRNSQLGNLRRVLTRLGGPANREAVERWTDHVEPSGRWPKEALAAVLDSVDAKQETIWEWLCIWPFQENESLFCGLPPDEIKALRSSLWAEAVRTLYAAAIHAEVRDRERVGPRGHRTEDDTEEHS